MWYVNLSNDFIFLATTMSFILTMWYVNLFLAKDVANWIERFILTMWYVNFSAYSYNCLCIS